MSTVRAPGAPSSIDGLQVLVQSHLIMASKCTCKLARSRPPSLSPNSLDHGLQVYHYTRSIMASKSAGSRPPSASPNLHDYGPQVHISKLPPSRPPSSHEQGLQVHLYTRSITISECISKFNRPGPPSVSPNTLNYRSKCIFKLAR